MSISPTRQMLDTACEMLYKPAGLKLTSQIKKEAESAQYSAHRFGLNGENVAYRVAKTTPTKIGQFVTIWKRAHPQSPIKPFDRSDQLSFVVITVHNKEEQGQFVFNKDVLLSRGIMSDGIKKGKLAIRVYPPWSEPTSSQAKRTQNWQLPYYLPVLKEGNASNLGLVRRLFGCKPAD
jgi:hypothetical protein